MHELQHFIIIIKYSVIKELSATDKNDNLTCEIIYGNFICDDYR